VTAIRQRNGYVFAEEAGEMSPEGQISKVLSARLNLVGRSGAFCGNVNLVGQFGVFSLKNELALPGRSQRVCQTGYAGDDEGADDALLLGQTNSSAPAEIARTRCIRAVGCRRRR
jgi:hypothetical protein